MTDLLPKGFGTTSFEPDGTPTKEIRKCKLGLLCDPYGSKGERCKLHSWTHMHDDSWIVIRIAFWSALAIGSIMIAFTTNFSNNVEPAQLIIEGFNCMDLAEYIADKSPEYRYAEHRYEWLCVNEQVKEFTS